MNYEQEYKQIFNQVGVRLLTNKSKISEVDIKIEIGKLLVDKFGNTLGKLLEEGVGFSPRNGLDEINLMVGLTDLKNEIETYFSQEINVVDAYYLLKIKWACYYSALLNKKELLVKFADIGLKYYDKSDNNSWNRTMDEWEFLLNQPDEFINAICSLKKVLGEESMNRQQAV